MTTTKFTIMDIKAQRSPSDCRYVSGTVGKYYVFSAKVDDKKTILGFKRKRVSHLTVYRKNSSRPFATYNYRHGIKPNNYRNKPLINLIRFYLESFWRIFIF